MTRWVPLLWCGCTFSSSGLDTAPDFATERPDTGERRDTADTSPGAVADTAMPETSVDAEIDSTVDAAVDVPPDVADARPDADVMPVRCDEPGAVLAAGHCYFVLAGPFDFAKARDACNARMPPAHLVSITSPAEQATAAARGMGDRWIGLIKDPMAPIAKASFKWVTGELSTVYDNWSAGDPNGGHNCARMLPGGLWGDQPCANMFPAICERE